MEGFFEILRGRIGDIKIAVSAWVADDTFIVSQKTFDRIKDAFPEARHEIMKSAPTFHRQPQTEICPHCSIDGTLYNNATGKWDIICNVCGGTGKLSAVR